jgi:hypothetical protein
MAAFLVRALGLPAGTGSARFVDDDDSLFEADIEALAAAGITRGCNPPANDRFCPDQDVTRGQMAAFLVRALDLTGGSDDFVDDDESEFEADIAALAAAGITRGCDPPANTRFCPDDSVTRGQMAAFLARALGLGQVTVWTFEEVAGDVLNPERGFHGDAEILDETDLSWLRDRGHSLVRAYIRLDDWRNAPLPQTLLDDLTSALEVARQSGVKVILRFAYNFGNDDDAPLDRVLEHLDQLEPVLAANSDVVAVYQAGFIGWWGEWHSSTNDLDTPENKATILAALLDAIPADRMVQLRYPGDIIDNYPDPVTSDEAFSGSDVARVGHHNDCWLSNEEDSGTYYPPERAEEFKSYLEASTEWTAMGAETCQLTPEEHRSDCPTTLEELERFHFSYVNRDFYEPDITRWETEGCLDEIEARLGYRFHIEEAALPSTVPAGGRLVGRLDVANLGWASPYNPRPVYLVLDSGSAREVIELDVDPRRWAPGTTTRIRFDLPAPDDGTYTMALWMPDAALADDPRFSVRLASDDVWDDTEGWNILGEVTVGS